MTEILLSYGAVLKVLDAATEHMDRHAETDPRTGHTAATVKTAGAVYQIDRGAVTQQLRLQTITFDGHGHVREGVTLVELPAGLQGRPEKELTDLAAKLAEATPVPVEIFRRARDIASPTPTEKLSLKTPVVAAGNRIRHTTRRVWRKATLAA